LGQFITGFFTASALVLLQMHSRSFDLQVFILGYRTLVPRFSARCLCSPLRDYRKVGFIKEYMPQRISGITSQAKSFLRRLWRRSACKRVAFAYAMSALTFTRWKPR
jgi:hypothetical protein